MKRCFVVATLLLLLGVSPAFNQDTPSTQARQGQVAEPSLTADGVSQPTAGTTAASLPELEQAIGVAKPGERIVLADGVYTSAAPIKIQGQGTPDHPILITAATIGGAEINGVGSFTFTDNAKYVVVRGFKFTHAPEAIRVPPGASHCRISRCLFELAVSGRSTYLEVAGSDCEIDHNEFRNKQSEGEMLLVVGPGTDEMAQNTWIHHNYFHDFRSPRKNNCSAIQIGMSGRSMSSAHSITEHNLFVKCAGENEGCICNKSSDNIYRFNTFGEGSTELSIRHGNRCEVYANFFIGSQGIRFFGHDHKIYSNYFERCNPAIHIGNGDGIIPPAKLTAHDKPVGEAVVFNTLVNNKRNITMIVRNRGLGAENIVVADNIILGGPPAAVLSGPMKDSRWQGNIVWGTNGGAGDIPVDGFKSIDPQLKPDEAGEYRLRSISLAIATAAKSFPYVTVDVHGRQRGSNPVAGADQPSTADAVSQILSPDDVGLKGVEPQRVLPLSAASAE